MIFISFLCMLIVICTLCMLYTSKTLYSVYFLILVFILFSLLLFIINIEFLAIIYLMLYLGAIMVLYLFVVMFIGSNLIEDLKFAQTNKKAPINLFIGFLILIQLLFFLYMNPEWILGQSFFFYANINYFNYIYLVDFLNILGYIIYDYYPIALLLGSLILLVAMMGAIILTLPFLTNDYKKKK